MSIPEVGAPLNEILGGSLTLASSSGNGFCGNVLKACGFDVKEEAGFAKSGPGNDIASLALTNNKPSAPSGP